VRPQKFGVPLLDAVLNRCDIRANQKVESRNLLDKSEGQPPIPTFTGRAMRSLSNCDPELVHAGGDDPLVKQETMRGRPA
jgi:hypothetical protein